MIRRAGHLALGLVLAVVLAGLWPAAARAAEAQGQTLTLVRGGDSL